MLKAEGHNVEKRTINGVDCTIETYCIGGEHHCHIANVSPGANIARATGPTREAAVQAAMQKAESRIVKR